MENELNWLDRVLANCPSGNCALYIRHAARDSGATVSGHIATVLTPEDEVLARSFGSRLKGRLEKVITAPKSRSQRTSQLILEGVGLDDEAIPAPVIGDPSAYFVDEEALISQLGVLPPDTARQSLLNGILRERAQWAHPDPRSAAKTILETIVRAITPGKIHGSRCSQRLNRRHGRPGIGERRYRLASRLSALPGRRCHLSRQRSNMAINGGALRSFALVGGYRCELPCLSFSQNSRFPLHSC